MPCLGSGRHPTEGDQGTRVSLFPQIILHMLHKVILYLKS